jgi:hypothetical protein
MALSGFMMKLIFLRYLVAKPVSVDQQNQMSDEPGYCVTYQLRI